MCRFKSGIILKNKIVLTPKENESHSALLESLNIEDTRMNAMRRFVRAELVPPNGNKAASISEWEYTVDQDITPNWYDKDKVLYENEFRAAVAEYIKNENFIEIGGFAWQIVVLDGFNYYFMDGFMKESRFGVNNNYAESVIRKELNESNLAKEIKDQFGDKLVPITTDLLSLDGLDDYGVVEGDSLAIPTLDLYRKCRKYINKMENLWPLATPDSTPSGYGSDDVRYVRSNGSVGCNWYGLVCGVRPFFITKS